MTLGAPWLLGLSILLAVTGQIALKVGSGAAPGWAQFLHPASLGGLVAYFGAALLYMVAIRTLPLSVAFPSASLSYVLVAYLAHLIWKEPFGWSQLLGLLFIMGGITLVTYRPSSL
ncbi:EamA family transporter [Candidatus Berkelbacteria bacterium]|nr:EamA family transporter [Candidatus Berkelbacteria bacterium]